MAESREERYERKRQETARCYDRLDATADVLNTLNPVVGLPMKGAVKVLRYVAERADQEAYRRQG